jgi:hypothetical protein
MMKSIVKEVQLLKSSFDEQTKSTRSQIYAQDQRLLNIEQALAHMKGYHNEVDDQNGSEDEDVELADNYHHE